MTTIIGITGLAGSGKDTAAAALVRDRGYMRIGLADAVKVAVTRLNSYVQQKPLRTVHTLLVKAGWNLHEDDPSFLAAWDEIKTYTECRHLLQKMGTEVGRDLFGQEVWLDVAMRKAATLERVVIPDIRFANEAQRVIDAGGLVIGVERPGVVPLSGHSSESLQAWPLVSVTVTNDATVEALEATVLDIEQEWSAAIKAYPLRWITVDEVHRWDEDQVASMRSRFANLPNPVPTVSVVNSCRPLLCPDCKAGKHDNCSGSWCVEHDHAVGCPCEHISH